MRNSYRLIATIALAISGLAACGTTIHRVRVNQVPLVSIEFVEHRTFFSTTAVAIIHEDGRIIGFGSGTGKPIAGFVADLTSAAVLGGVLGYIGMQLPKINTGTSTVNVTDINGGGP